MYYQDDRLEQPGTDINTHVLAGGAFAGGIAGGVSGSKYHKDTLTQSGVYKNHMRALDNEAKANQAIKDMGNRQAVLQDRMATHRSNVARGGMHYSMQDLIDDRAHKAEMQAVGKRIVDTTGHQVSRRNIVNQRAAQVATRGRAFRVGGGILGALAGAGLSYGASKGVDAAREYFNKSASLKVSSFNPAMLADDAIVIGNYIKSKEILKQYLEQTKQEREAEKQAAVRDYLKINMAKNVGKGLAKGLAISGAYAAGGALVSMYGPEFLYGPARDESGELTEERFNASRAAKAALTAMVSARAVAAVPGHVSDAVGGRYGAAFKAVPGAIAVGSAAHMYHKDGEIDFGKINKRVSKASLISGIGLSSIADGVQAGIREAALANGQ